MTVKNNDENFIKVSLINQNVRLRKRKTCPLINIPDEAINYKNIDLLSKFISDRGKMLSTRITSVSRKKQKKLATSIKNARQLALLSPVKKINVE
jgi:small subunit ribosomal protein S18|tara:strand:+ start:1346 stop:1630 length:285 start_codon:yes stop_codon:yes gene_type:complete